MAGGVRISVRNLVEFILRSGDIDDRRQGSPENAMQEAAGFIERFRAEWAALTGQRCRLASRFQGMGIR